MKKVLIIVGILVVVIGAGVTFVLLKPGSQKAFAIESVLPAGPVALLGATDLDKNLTSLFQTEMWKTLSAIDYKKALKSSGAQDQDLANFDRISEQIKSPATQMIVKKFFGREAMIAFYPVDIEQFSPEAINKLAGNLFFVTRLSPEVKFIDVFSKMLGKSSADMTVESVSYQKHTLYTVTGKDGALKVSYVQIGDLLVFGITDNAAKTCLDVVAGLKRSLKDDAAYKEVKARYMSGAAVTGFLNFEDIYIGLKSQALKMAAVQGDRAKAFEQQMENNFRQMQGFKAIGYSIVFAPVSRAKFDVTYNKSELAEETRPIYDCAPKANNSLAFVPQDALGYQWTACQDFKLYWTQYQRDMENAAKAEGQKIEVKDMVAQMETNLKFSIEGDLLAAIGDEMGGYVTDVDLTGAFPLPKLVVFLKINDQGKAVKVLEAMLAQQPVVRPEESDYNGTKIKYLTIPMMDNLQPGYAFLGDYLLISSNWDLIKQAVDTKAGKGAALSANPSLGQLGADLNAPANAAFFLQIDAVMKKAEAMVDWSIQWAAMQASKQAAFKSGSQQRLADIDSEIKQHETQLETLRSELKSLGDVGAAPSTPPVAADPAVAATPPAGADTGAANTVADRQARLNQQIADEEKALVSVNETKAELEQMIKQLDEVGDLDIQSRQVLADEMAKPLIRAFTAFKGFASRMTFGDGVIQNDSFWRME